MGQSSAAEHRTSPTVVIAHCYLKFYLHVDTFHNASRRYVAFIYIVATRCFAACDDAIFLLQGADFPPDYGCPAGTCTLFNDKIA